MVALHYWANTRYEQKLHFGLTNPECRAQTLAGNRMVRIVHSGQEKNQRTVIQYALFCDIVQARSQSIFSTVKLCAGPYMIVVVQILFLLESASQSYFKATS